MDYAYNEMARNKHGSHDYNQSVTQYPLAKKYPLLTQFGILTDLLNSTNIDTIRSIHRDIEKLNSDHKLSFMCMNSTREKTISSSKFDFVKESI